MNADHKQAHKHRHVLITGASSGIGRALAVYYAAEGCVLSLSGRNEARLSEVVQACRDGGAASVDAQIIDVIDEAAMAAWIVARDDACALDLVIANAGISGGTGASGFGETSDQVKRIFDVNLNGVLNTIAPILPRMETKNAGQIAIMSSLAGYRGWPGAPAYCASKSAVKSYGESLRVSLAGCGVRVNVICPGFVKSAMTDVNDFPMPFLMSAEKATTIIVKGLEKNKGRIAFPLPMVFMAWLFSSMPDCFAAFLLRFSPKKI